MNTEEFRETLDTLKESELIHYVQKYVCLSLTDASDPAAEVHTLLDLVYVECVRRNKERMYDKIYETMCRDPEVCRILIAA